MKAHEYAEKLKAAAEFLLARENVEMKDTRPFIPLFFWKKDDFVAAVKIFGQGKKEWKNDDLVFTPAAPCDIFSLHIRRSSVCRLVRPAEYDCEPILSEEEVAAL